MCRLAGQEAQKLILHLHLSNHWNIQSRHHTGIEISDMLLHYKNQFVWG